MKPTKLSKEQILEFIDKVHDKAKQNAKAVEDKAKKLNICVQVQTYPYIQTEMYKKFPFECQFMRNITGYDTQHVANDAYWISRHAKFYLTNDIRIVQLKKDKQQIKFAHKRSHALVRIAKYLGIHEQFYTEVKWHDNDRWIIKIESTDTFNKVLKLLLWSDDLTNEIIKAITPEDKELLQKRLKETRGNIYNVIHNIKSRIDKENANFYNSDLILHKLGRF